MTYDYLAAFPLPVDAIPNQLRKLLTPIGLNPSEEVEVARFYEQPDKQVNDEHLYLQMAVVQGGGYEPIPVFSETGRGVVAYSTPVEGFGAADGFKASISGHDYIVASWGDGSFYTFNLAESVWMTLGLSPRCIGNDHQKLIYDDLGQPEVGVAGGEISSEYYWKSTRNIHWSMRNDYFRKYLWLRSARAVRTFYFRSRVEDHPAIRCLMGIKTHIDLKPDSGPAWYELDIRMHQGHLVLQVWACVEVAGPELCPELSADGLVWPGISEPTHRALVRASFNGEQIYLDDQFLERYEQSAFYDSMPVQVNGQWHCSPSYKAQWGFSGCVRVGRNLISATLDDLYGTVPDREVRHAHKFARSVDAIAHLNLNEEHIVSKTQRLLDQLVSLDENLSVLARSAGLQAVPEQLTGFNKIELYMNGWESYPNLGKLAQVAPLTMTQQAFLSRCKQVHEILQKVPNGFVKQLLEKAGCPRKEINGFALLKCLEALLNVVQRLNADQESLESFSSQVEPEGWNARNPKMAALFLNNDLRIADAHDTVGMCIKTLQTMGFDTAHLNDGYGHALDFVIDGVIDALGSINGALALLLSRSSAPPAAVAAIP